jgi:WD40 repeat protein/serine/threonine protein kinase
MANLIGQSVGRYQILEQLGEGGMATVYKAFDTRLDRDVAVKVIRRAAFPPEQLDHILKRFEREAKALAKLSHPNIVGIIDYGEYEGSPYLVMEFLPSGTLTQYLGKPVPWPEAARLLLPVARALQFAHKKGVVHRDIKPANILITDSGEPMLSDFGIAKILESEETTNLTGTGFGIGTPAYMAPEQWAGRVGPQSDIYSLGVVFYEMVTGRKPYTADTPSAIMLKQATEPLPRPKTFAPDLPDSVEKVLLKALAHKPENRFADMAAFVDASEQVLAGQSKGKRSTGSKPVFAPKVQPPAETKATFVQRESPSGAVPEAARRPESQLASIPGKRIIGSRWAAIGAGLIVLISIGVIGLRGQFSASKPPTAALIATLSPTGMFTGTYTRIYTPTATPFPKFPIYHAVSFPESLLPISSERAAGVDLITRLGDGILVQAAWSPDGSTLAVASSTGIYLYDAITKEEIQFIESSEGVKFLAFSPDGTLLAGGMRGWSVRIWQVSDGSLLRTMEGHSGAVTSVAFTPDGTMLASAGWDGTIRYWQVSDGRLVMTWSPKRRGLLSIAFSPDGAVMACGTSKGEIFLWRVSDGIMVRILYGHLDRVQSVAISPDGSLLASASLDKTVRLWHLSDGTLFRILEGHADQVQSVAFSADGSLLASGSTDQTIRIWRTSDGVFQKTLEGHSSSVDSLAFSPDGTTLASVGQDKRVLLWQIPDGEQIYAIENHENSILAAAFSPDGTSLAFGGSPGPSVSLVRVSDGTAIAFFNGHTSSVYGVAFSPDGTILASGSSDSIARLWRTADGLPIYTLSGHTCGVNSVAFSPDGSLLATGSCDNTVRLWRVSDGSLLSTLEGHSEGVQTVAFSPDGTILASGSADKTIRLWRIPDGTLIRSLTGHSGLIHSVAFSPDGVLLASGSGDNTVRIWRIANGTIARVLYGHTDEVSGVAFSPDGSLLASASYDITIRFSRVSDGVLVSTLKGHTHSLYGVVFSPDGSLLASYSFDGTIRLCGIVT